VAACCPWKLKPARDADVPERTGKGLGTFPRLTYIVNHPAQAGGIAKIGAPKRRRQLWPVSRHDNGITEETSQRFVRPIRAPA